ALELYRSNHVYGSYPQQSTWETDLVNGNYLSSIPTDPKTKLDYTYTPSPSGCSSSDPLNICKDYVLSTELETGLSYVIGPYGEITTTPGATSTPTPPPGATNTPTPPPGATSTPTPTPGQNTCSSYCASLGGYTGGTCRDHWTSCSANGQVYQSGGNQFCTGGASADTCCCTPATQPTSTPTNTPIPPTNTPTPTPRR
ncbi:hypothetical protein HYT32_02640, partial [Candidatus Roizmanbacteria bacterium]|nr:hypothetical protein [Candidatus Roizmanbacteria bacterium]